MASGGTSEPAANHNPRPAFDDADLVNNERSAVEFQLSMMAAASDVSDAPTDPVPAPAESCRACGITPTKMCSGCKSARYCSPACQKTDWPNHKLLCLEERAKEKERRKTAAKVPRPPIDFYYPPDEEDEAEGYSRCVHLASTGDAQDSDLHLLTGASDVVVPEGERSIKVYFSYPFANAQVIKLRSPSARGGFTRQEFAQAVATKYKEIYEEEEHTQTAEPQSAPGVINRGFSDGTWGIWGHDLWDLQFHTATYNHQQGVYTLGIDS